MVEIQQIQNQLRQQRQSIEEARRRALSQQNIRQTSLLQRQQQARRLQQQEQQVTSVEQQVQEQLRQQQLSESQQQRQQQKQEALRILVEKGKGSSALYSLTPQERAEVEAIASDIKSSRERSAGIVAVSKAEQALSSSLAPELRKQIYIQGASGASIITLPNLGQKTNLQFTPLNQPQYTPFRLEPVQTVKQQFYTPAPLSITDPVEFRRQQIEKIRTFPTKQFQKISQATGMVAEQYAESTRGKGYVTLDASGVLPYTPAQLKTPEEIGTSVKRTTDVGLYFVPVVGQVKIGAEVIGASSFREAATTAGLVGAGNLFFKAGKGVAAAEVPQVSTKFYSLVEPKGKDFQALTIAETTRVTSKGTEKFRSVITEKGVIKPKNIVDTFGTGMVRKVDAPKETTRFFRVTSRGKVTDAAPSVKEINLPPFSLYSRKELKGAKEIKGYTGTWEDNIINIERSRGLSIPVVPNKLSIGVVEGSMSGRAKGLTIVYKEDVKPLEVVGKKMKKLKTTQNIYIPPTTQVEKVIEQQLVPQTIKSPILDTKATALSVSKPKLLESKPSEEVVKQTKPILNFETLELQSTTPSVKETNLLALKESQIRLQQPKESKIQSQPLARAEGTAISTKTLSGLLLGFRKAQAQRQRQIQQTRQITRTTPLRPPIKIKTPKIISFPEDSISISKVGTQDDFGVGIEIKRFGKFQKIGEETTLERALKKGAKLTDVTLARSFRLRDIGTGELLDVSALPIGFRRAKSLPKTFVEESRFALSTGGEKGEIKYFKNVKNRKSRRLI